MAEAKMSIVLVVYGESHSLRLVLDRLRLQTAAPVLECVLVATSKEKPAILSQAGALSGLAAIKVMEMNTIESAGRAKAAGIAAASAPLVALLEDHSLPESDWAELLIRAHETSDYAAVAPVIKNANPGTAASWGCFLVYYGQDMFARSQDELKHLPGNHSCYRRNILLEYKSRLPDLLEAEFVLHQDLRTRGFRLFQDPGACAFHINHPRLRSSLEEYVLSSRVFATERAAKWKLTRRVSYVFGSPMIPFVRLLRIAKYIRKAGLDLGSLSRAAPAVFLILCSGAAGEMMGYAFGAGNARAGLRRFESERHRAITRQDLETAGLI
jgi:GT2 family glycosyltransferase